MIAKSIITNDATYIIMLCRSTINSVYYQPLAGSAGWLITSLKQNYLLSISIPSRKITRDPIP